MKKKRSGEKLPKGLAKKQYDAYLKFLKKLRPSKKKLFPEAVCFHIVQLQNYIAGADKMLEAAGVEPAKRGIALMLGINECSKPHPKGKLTVMFVASSFESNAEGKVTKIDNCVFNPPPSSKKSVSINNQVKSKPGLKKTIQDDCFDAGDLRP